MPDDHSLEHLYLTHFAHFVRVASAICGEPDGGGDVVQEAFVKALRSLDTFRGDGGLEGWVWRIVVNTAKRRRTVDARTIGLDEAADALSIDDTRAAVVRERLRRLPERQRLVVFLRYYADLDYTTIAEILEIEVGTVSATLSAAHTTLRALLMEVR